MTYESLETSIESGRPVELYHFTIASIHYYYTSAPDSFLLGGNTYLPRQLTHTNPSQSTEERRSQIEVTIPTEDPVASRFVGVIPGLPMFLEIAQYHRGDTEVFVIWTGVIAGATYKKQGGECTLRGITTEASFSHAIPRYKYQGMCNHVLFDANCQAVANSFRFVDACTGVSGDTVTVGGIFAAHGADWMQGGYLNLNDSDYRLVIAQSGDVLTMYLPFEENPLGQDLECFAGCGHTTVDCENKFNNLINYGGFAFVPELNPFVVGMD
jgi:hypothetical protein